MEGLSLCWRRINANNVESTAIKTIIDITIGNITVTLWNMDREAAECDETLVGGCIEPIFMINEVFVVTKRYSASVIPLKLNNRSIINVK